MEDPNDVQKAHDEKMARKEEKAKAKAKAKNEKRKFQLPEKMKKVQQIHWYKFFTDLAYQHRNLGMKDQWAAVFAENVTKSLMRKHVTQNAKMPFRDDEIESLMKDFFTQNKRQGDTDQIDFGTFQYSLQQLTFHETNENEVEIKVFFNKCSIQDLGFGDRA